jgi:hypothetical protein
MCGQDSGGSLTNLQAKSPCPFVLRSIEDQVTVRGRAEWISDDQAYVLVPYGTARSFRQCWNATAVVPVGDAPGQSHELRMTAQLMSAEARYGLESETEGLLLRLTRTSDGQRLGLVDILPTS